MGLEQHKMRVNDDYIFIFDLNYSFKSPTDK